MYEWVKVQLKEYSSANLEERHAWWITLKWYFGYCAKKELGEPINRDNGRFFGEMLYYLPNRKTGKKYNGEMP